MRLGPRGREGATGATRLAGRSREGSRRPGSGRSRRPAAQPPERPAKRRRGSSDLGSRLLIAIPAAALAIFLVIEGGLIFTAGLFLFGALCLHELFTMYGRLRPVRLAAFASLAAMLLIAQYAGRADLILVAVASLPVVFGLALIQPEASAEGIAITLLGLWWIGFGLAHAVLLRGLPHGGGVVLDVLVGTFIGDTGAYLGGRLFGRRPLASALSPNKTVEGLIAGMIAAVVAVWLASRYQSFMPGTQALVLGLGVAVLAPIGDLFESFIKRRAGVKDTGRAFGAHGGALDRLDAVLFTVVVGYYIWLAYT